MRQIVLSLGSNIDRENNIRFALQQIEQNFGDCEISPIYETVSVGFEGPNFFNLVLGFEDDQPLLQLRDQLRGIESDAGRVRGAKSFANRVLDIDVLLFGEDNLRSQGFNIPRDEIEKYAYVLKPLADLYPDRRHPLFDKTFKQMWQEFQIQDENQSDQKLEVADFIR